MTDSPTARLRAYLAEHLLRPRRILSTLGVGSATGETVADWSVTASTNHYGDLGNILDMLPDVFAEVARLEAENESLRTKLRTLRQSAIDAAIALNEREPGHQCAAYLRKAVYGSEVKS